MEPSLLDRLPALAGPRTGARRLRACIAVPVRDEAASLPRLLGTLAAQHELAGGDLSRDSYEVVLLRNNFTDRSGAERETHAAFDAACAWIVHHGDRSGPILTRHPGEVFLQTGRHALAPAGGDPGAIERWIHRHGVAYLFVDGARYANAPPDPLAVWAQEHPSRVKMAWGEAGGVAVYAVRE